MTADRLLGVAEVCGRLGVGKSFVYAEVAAGRLASVRLGRAVRVPEQALAAYVAARTTGAPRLAFGRRA